MLNVRGLDQFSVAFLISKMPFDREKMKHLAAALATKGVYIGTSSWKYRGWLNQLYNPTRYEKQKKAKQQESASFLFSELNVAPAPPVAEQIDKKRFDAECLAEYGEVFKTVCFDGAFYKFPSRQQLTGMAEQVPSDFRFGFKVTDAITVKRYPSHPDYGSKAGQLNENFLNADLFGAAFLEPCKAIRSKVGILMFEFSQFGSSEYKHVSDFIPDLDEFLGKLPKGWSYGVELRNREWLQPDYFNCLQKHGVTHVFNNWEAMPSVGEQMALPGSRTNPEVVAARFLLKPGRTYRQAVKLFEEYEKVKEANPDARAAGKALIDEAVSAAIRKLYLLYFNNRLEGNAPETIAAVVESYYLNVIKPQLEGHSR